MTTSGGGIHHSEDRLWGAVEILPQRLYYAPLRFFPPDEIDDDGDGDDNNNENVAKATTRSSITGKTRQQPPQQQPQPSKETKKKQKKKPIHYFSIDSELIYWNFFLDFGPLNLGHLYRFCEMLNNKLSLPEYKDHIICYYSGPGGTKRANAAYLICAYQMLFLGRTLEESYFGFVEPPEGGGGGVGGEEEEEEEEGKRRRRRHHTTTTTTSCWSNAAMAALAGSDDEEERTLTNVSLPPRQQRRMMKQPQHRHHHRLHLHFPHRLTSSSSSSGGGSAVVDHAGHSASQCPFVPIHPLPPYHDASPILCTYDLTVYDCLAGLRKARQFGFFDFGNTITAAIATAPPTFATTDDDNNNNNNNNNNNEDDNTTTTTTPRPQLFDINEYEHFEQVENGDLNWIIAHEICAFAGPLAKKNTTPNNDDTDATTTTTTTEGMYYNLTPAEYIPYFQKRNVQLVIRLNNASCYDASDFINAGINHVTHYYMDGSCPTMDILHAVIEDMEYVIHRGEKERMMDFEEEEGSMEEAEDDEVEDVMGMGEGGRREMGESSSSSSRGGGGGGAVAVHCKAGLGRTGTCIGAYIMKHYMFTAAEVIGYMRICRPGMVIGPQQHFLAGIESLMWQEGDVYRITMERLRGIAPSSAEEFGGDSCGLRKMSIDSDNGGEEGRQQLRMLQTATTPRAEASPSSATVSGGVGGGAHVSIVTPDGQPFRLLTTPVNARKLHIVSSIDGIDPSPISSTKSAIVRSKGNSPAMLQPRHQPLQEGDQANELLSRRNRHKVQHRST